MEAVPENTPQTKRPFRVLSLDGGGMRGIYTASFLEHLVDLYRRIRGVENLDLGKGFDLITGTSTGAIVACGAAIGRPMGDMVSLYSEWGPKIFPERLKETLTYVIARALKGGSIVKAGDLALREALAAELGTITMLDVYKKRGISLAIPAVDMSTHRSYVFKKNSLAELVRDDDRKLVDVCLASSAAPIFRSLAAVDKLGDRPGLHEVFADGGLWANNPILVGMLDALRCAPADCPIEIYSLGTCARPSGDVIARGDVHWSIVKWRMGGAAASISISAQEYAFDNMARLFANILGECGRDIKLVRFPKKEVPAAKHEFLGLDDARQEAMAALIGQASTDADTVKSACDDPTNVDGQLIRHLMMSLPTMPKAGVPKEFFK